MSAPGPGTDPPARGGPGPPVAQGTVPPGNPSAVSKSASSLAPAGDDEPSTAPAGALAPQGPRAGPPAGSAPQVAVAASPPAGAPSRASPPGASATARGPRRARRAQWMQSRGAVRHVHVGTVAKVSLVFYFLVLAGVVVATIILWYVASAFGAIHSIERSIQTLFDLKNFKLHEARVIGYVCGGGAVLAIAGAIANVIAACMYNLISDVVGGVKVDVVVAADSDAGAGPGPP
ncbi:MAG: DUF3566 domain-containing protein [Acidimicrobiales bacterium]